MCFCECVSECFSVNVFPRMCFQFAFSTPYGSSTNGEVECFNRRYGKAIQCSHAKGKNWKKEIEQFLLQYRTAPHTITNVPLAPLFFRHTPCNDLPSIYRRLATGVFVLITMCICQISAGRTSKQNIAISVSLAL